jgi:hypothetical protein
MYGLIHKAMRGMVLAQYGEDTWAAILKNSKVDVDAFLALRSYDDHVAFALVEATSNVLQIPPEKCLREFGKSWVLNTAKQNYASLLQSHGSGVWEFLENLDNLHGRINSLFPYFQPPSFSVVKLDDSEGMLHYKSLRTGLTSFVIGQVEGLGELFDETVTILSIESKSPRKGEYSIVRLKVVGTLANAS